jgi:hypothetical protein
MAFSFALGFDFHGNQDRFFSIFLLLCHARGSILEGQGESSKAGDAGESFHAPTFLRRRFVEDRL